MACSSAKGTSLPMTAAACSRCLSSGGSRSMRAASTACTVAGTCSAPAAAPGGMLPALPRQRPASPPAPAPSPPGRTGLPSARSTNRRLSGARLGCVAEQSVAAAPRHSAAAADRGGAACSSLAAPAVLILGPVRDEEQQARAGQALDQAVQQRLGLGVDPVQVLEDQEQRLHAGSPAAAAVSRRRACAGGAGAGQASATRVLHGHIEQREQRGERRLEDAVQGAAACPSPSRGSPRSSSRSCDREVALEQVDHRAGSSSPCRRRRTALSSTSQSVRAMASGSTRRPAATCRPRALPPAPPPAHAPPARAPAPGGAAPARRRGRRSG